MTILKIRGVELKINLLFFVICFLFALVGNLARVLITFSVVFLHELGHVLMAYHYQIKIKKIEILPFGGVAELKDSFEVDPKIERKVALAGPLVNLGLVLLTSLLIRYDFLNNKAALFFITCNLGIGLFNLLPALPLDGGRILRASIASFYGYWKATHYTLRITQVFAVLMGVLAFISWFMGQTSMITLVIAFFVYFAALKEEEQSIYVLIKYLTRKKEKLISLKIVPGQQYIVLSETRISKLLKIIHPTTFTQFLVYDRDYQFLGILNENKVVDAFFQEGKNVPIRELLNG